MFDEYTKDKKYKLGDARCPYGWIDKKGIYHWCDSACHRFKAGEILGVEDPEFNYYYEYTLLERGYLKISIDGIYDRTDIDKTLYLNKKQIDTLLELEEYMTWEQKITMRDYRKKGII